MTFLRNVPQCAYSIYGGCGGKLQDDHVIPVARGGNQRPENFQKLCATHNIDKGALTHEEYMAKLHAVGAPDSPERRKRQRGRRRPWEYLVGVGRPFERDALVALADEEFAKGNIGPKNAKNIETIRRMRSEWIVFDPDPMSWQGPLNPRNLRPARPDELKSPA